MTATNGEKNGKPGEAPRVPSEASATGGAGERAPGGGDGVAGLVGPAELIRVAEALEGSGESSRLFGDDSAPLQDVIDAAARESALAESAPRLIRAAAATIERLTRELAQIRAAGSDLESDKDKYRDARCLTCGNPLEAHPSSCPRSQYVNARRSGVER